jgi:hypothetical protein
VANCMTYSTATKECKTDTSWLQEEIHGTGWYLARTSDCATDWHWIEYITDSSSQWELIVNRFLNNWNVSLSLITSLTSTLHFNLCCLYYCRLTFKTMAIQSLTN